MKGVLTEFDGELKSLIATAAKHRDPREVKTSLKSYKVVSDNSATATGVLAEPPCESGWDFAVIGRPEVRNGSGN